MTDRDRSDSEALNAEDTAAADAIETGEPIEALRAFAVAPRPGFMARIRDSIQRRALTSQFADLSWKAVTTVIMEYLTLAFGLFASKEPNQRGSE